MVKFESDLDCLIVNFLLFRLSSSFFLLQNDDAFFALKCRFSNFSTVTESLKVSRVINRTVQRCVLKT